MDGACIGPADGELDGLPVDGDGDGPSDRTSLGLIDGSELGDDRVGTMVGIEEGSLVGESDTVDGARESIDDGVLEGTPNTGASDKEVGDWLETVVGVALSKPVGF